MKKPSDNSARENGNDEPETGTNRMPPERLLEFAREYFTDGFPNSDRRGCPDCATLNSLAWSGCLPDEELRGHLFGCSECFSEYRVTLTDSKDWTNAGDNRRDVALADSVEESSDLLGKECCRRFTWPHCSASGRIETPLDMVAGLPIVSHTMGYIKNGIRSYYAHTGRI